MKHIPSGLIVFRMVAGAAILLLRIYHIPHYNIIAVSLLIAGLISDILDGIIARRLGISSERLRRLDSAADQLFFILAAIATYIQCTSFFHDNKFQLIILGIAEAAIYAVSWLKFKKEVATHAIASKAWVLTIVAVLIQVMLTCNSSWLFQICFYIGVITRLEIIGILLIIPSWANDVPSIFHAIKIKKGLPVKRNKLFNG
jgi:CDP-diacylglycerol--glycerol-3-phosphate 3-phosphatidyltransferase